MTVRALVTGANGFVAQWAVRAMLERGWEVTGASHGGLPGGGLLSAAERGAVRWRTTDVTRDDEVAAAVDEARADHILHLAAVSHVPDAARQPALAYEVNVVGTVRLLARVARHRRAGTGDPTVLVIGSAEQYGRYDMNALPLHEGLEQRPLTVYAASKAAQEVAALQSYRSDGVRVICTRSFSHSGPGHGAGFLLPSLVTRALALPPEGGTLTIGNGDTIRDFLHVNDAVAGYLALFDHGAAGQVYNVCSGAGVSVRGLARAVLARVGRSAELASDPSLARTVDVPAQVGSNMKLRRACGWMPRLTRDDIIDDLINAATR